MLKQTKQQKLIIAYKEHIKLIQKIYSQMPKPQDDTYLIRKADPESIADRMWGDVRDKDRWEKDFNNWLKELGSIIYGVVSEGES